MNIRQIEEKDVELFLNLMMELDNETKFMMLEPGERKNDLYITRSIIKNNLENSFMYVVEEENKLVGFLTGERGSANRIKHTVYIVIGILGGHRGKGIGRQLFEELEIWAGKNNIKRLELTVMTHNKKAVNLYRKMGFKIEGVKEHSILLDGKFIDEYYMGKIL
ncbi:MULTISPECIES: GNAT family N-acetyltransferase [Psychrilyobacter]|uniref:GNAT family N-acetyltransferase n=1 Tax=Psychrilyobacter piezotolerans TaxID=2293438 RepID=A0ABX9KEN8_9FUSO|nr:MULTISPECIES: GNAT family N-acetyltransferase [Psychrilyobacter]MCS5422331.1 GNAT family N-acetyltransferase [Psychrilyobacter sp. S5]NDI78722.1 GNAT family N-acetyltransferase [Psychrilyobacter piezotolerans]RDE59897.1 GNAT family N-acetyltransferase [Psychrilyobacter sp. S5]REI40178.1 GNAT family N-acetyltransferase [Psychrilyobacter piezotolerans]